MIAALLLGAGLAAAGEAVLAGGVQVATGAAEDVGKGGLGHDVRLGYTLGERWLVELGSTSLARPDAAHVDLSLGARRYLTEPWTDRGALSIDASAGVGLMGAYPALALGAAMDLPHRRRLTARVGAGLAVFGASDAPHSAARLALTVLAPPIRLAAPTAPLVLATPPPAPAPAAPLDLEIPPEAMVWVPHPICDWVPASQAELLIASLPEGLDPEAQLEILAEQHLPAHVHPEGHQRPELVAAPPDGMGALLVLAHPGDEVQVNGARVPVDDEGVALLNGPEGRVTVEVRAGGQRQTYKAALSNGYAVWIRVKAPPAATVTFSQGSSELSPASRDQIQAMARDAAGWSFVLQGAYSFEGSLNVNNRLARERGQNVGAALLAAGIPADRIAYLEPPSADPTKDPATQRVCNVIAVPPERRP